MPATHIHIKTLTQIINPDKNTENIFAIIKNTVYFIDTKKLDKILSLLCILKNFNDFIINTETRNITLWLKDHKLLTEEILEEISYSAINGSVKRNTRCINTFGNKYQTTADIMTKLLYQNIKYTRVFEYIKQNEREINRYTSRILTFFEKEAILDERESSFDFFINSLFATMKEEIFQTILTKNDFEIYPDKNQRQFCDFSLEKIICGEQEMLCSAIKSSDEFDFHMISENKNLLKNHFELSEHLNILKIKSEQGNISTPIFLPNFQTQTKTDTKCSINILNLNKILFLSLNSENRFRLINLVNGYKNIFLYKKGRQSSGIINLLELNAA